VHTATKNRLGLCAALALFLTSSQPGAAQNTTPRSLDEYRRHALTRPGDAARGAALFADEKRLGCAKCHSIDGTASKAGPDLSAAGDAFGRWDLVESVLLPSAKIAPGYGTVTVETKSGETIQGILKQSTGSGIQLMGGDGKLVAIAKADILKQEGSAVSLMPEGLQAGLSLQEFTDLTEYLTTHQRSRHAGADSRTGQADRRPTFP
jgi:putative heme-binding domain-containing protein